MNSEEVRDHELRRKTGLNFFINHPQETETMWY